MKKVLLIALLCLFVANAYALDVRIFGFNEFRGVYVANNSVGKGDTADDRAYFDQSIRIWTNFIVDPKTTITLRSTPLDRVLWGAPRNTVTGGSIDGGKNTVTLDRAWIGYMITDAFKFEAGRMTGNDFNNGFGSGLYDLTFMESGGRDQMKASYMISKEMSVWGAYIKNLESSTQGPAVSAAGGHENGQDSSSYLLGGKFDLSGVVVTPTLGLTDEANGVGTKRSQIISAYVGVAHQPATGLNLLGTLAYVTANKIEGVYPDGISAYGLYLDGSFVQDTFTVGGFLAYASYDKKKGWFNFGGDFDKTFILDDYFGDVIGVPANTMLQIYATMAPMDKVNVGAKGSYYMSNVDGDGGVYLGVYNAPVAGTPAIGKDTNAYEIDLFASYRFTPNTTFGLNFGYAKINDLVANGDKYNPDGIMLVNWSMYTTF